MFYVTLHSDVWFPRQLESSLPLHDKLWILSPKYSSNLFISAFHCQYPSPTWLPLFFCLVWTGAWAFCLISHYSFWWPCPLFCLRHQGDLFKMQILFIAAVFTKARAWNQPKYPLTEKREHEDMVHVYSGIVLSHRKEWNWVICRDVDGPKVFHTVSQKKINIVY